jgi:hypothetical protein
MKDTTAILALLCALAGAACGGSGMRLRPKDAAATCSGSNCTTDAGLPVDSPDAGSADVPMDHQGVADLAFYADTTSQADTVHFADTASPADGDDHADTTSQADTAAIPDTTSDTGTAAFDVMAPAFCTWHGNSIALGKLVDADDACNVCQCRSDGAMACTTDACPTAFDALPAVCSLGSALSFGVIGSGACGSNVRIDMFSLNAADTITVNRVYNGCGIDNQQFRSCAAPLPVCGANGVISLATIAQDLGRSDVKAAFAAGDSLVYGASLGKVWSVSQEGGGRIRVGSDCPPQATDACLAIPVGIARLANDLASLASDALASAACAGL